MLIQLDAVEARILGSLVEKSLTTPDQYPLTFNALINACNQKTSREPAMDLDADAAGRSLQALLDKELVERVQGSRVPRFRHYIERLVNGNDPKLIGTICVLLLRGPQTPGEIKGRTERLCTFLSTAETESFLQEMCAKAQDPFVARLARQAGQKETRYQHLFCGDVRPADVERAASPAQDASAGPMFQAEFSGSPAPAAPDRIVQLEKRVADLEASFQIFQQERAGH